MREASYPLSPFPPFQTANALLVCGLGLASTERVSAMREASYPLKTVSSSFLPNRFAGFAGNLRCQQNKPLIMQSNAHDKGRLCFYR